MEKILVEMDLFCPQERPFKDSERKSMPDDSVDTHRQMHPSSALRKSWYPVSHKEKVFFLSSMASKARAGRFVSLPQSLNEEKSTDQGGSSAHEGDSNGRPDESNPVNLSATNVSPKAKSDDTKTGGQLSMIRITEHPAGSTYASRPSTGEVPHEDSKTANDLPLEKSVPDENPTLTATKAPPMRSITVNRPPRESSFCVGTSAGPWPVGTHTDEPATSSQSAGETSVSPSNARETSTGNHSKEKSGSAESSRLSEGGDDNKVLSHTPSSHGGEIRLSFR